MFCVFLTLISCFNLLHSKVKKPNVLFIAVDDPNEFHNLAKAPSPEIRREIGLLQKSLRFKSNGKIPTNPVNPPRL
jgi:hypothetical protein